MRPIPKKLLKEMLNDPWYSQCARRDESCMGRITLEHSLIYAGRQVSEKFAIIPLCWEHHLGKKLDKRINEWIALSRATDADFAKYSKANWRQKLRDLEQKYGRYTGN